MAETITDFFDRISGSRKPRFRAEPWYNRDGDCIHYHWRPDDHYGDWIDDKLTLYRSIDTKEAVGCQIKGVTALIKKLGDFGISLKAQDGTPLALFLFASQTIATGSQLPPEDRERTYRYLIEQVAKQKVEFEPSIKV